MRRIDADALIAEWYKINDIGPEDCGARFVGYQEIARLIDNAPTVEPGGDYISRADAIEAVASITMSIHLSDVICDKLLALPSADAEPMTEEVREALMRLTMCAREECGMCKYKDKCGFEFQYNISTENMNTILEALPADAVQGEWILHDGYYCSNCNHKLQTTGIPQYCPSCGARMKGGAE